jgi:hypothetical protein
MSTPTLTLVSAPEPAPESAAALRDKLALAEQSFGDLLAAAKATLAAADGAHRGDPLSWLREHLGLLGQLPARSARPTDYVPADRDDATWGRW